MKTVLKAKNLSKWFGSQDAMVHVIKNVSLELNFGEMLYIVGPSGSGKTTLLSIISGILRPNSGVVEIKNRNICELNDDELAHFRLYSVGFVFQDFHLFPRLTSQENVAIPLILQKRDWDESVEEARKYLSIVGLQHKAEVQPYKMSLGEQQRVAIARAIISKPEILIFDEPTASLDGETGRKIMNFAKNDILNEKCAIIVVTHDNRIYNFATRILKMEDNELKGALNVELEAFKN